MRPTGERKTPTGRNRYVRNTTCSATGISPRALTTALSASDVIDAMLGGYLHSRHADLAERLLTA